MTQQRVKIGIFDTGLDVQYLTRNERIKGQFNSFNTKTIPIDRQGHGTDIYKIISESSPESDIYIYKALDDDGRGSVKSLNDCLKEARKYKIDIACIAMSSEQPLSLHNEQQLRLFAKHTELYAPNGKKMGHIEYPAKYDFVNNVPVQHEPIVINGKEYTGSSFLCALTVAERANEIKEELEKENGIFKI